MARPERPPVVSPEGGASFVREPALTASQLRADVYNVLDQVLTTGEPARIVRNGRVLHIVADRTHHWLDALPDRTHQYPDDVGTLASAPTPCAWSGAEPTP